MKKIEIIYNIKLEVYKINMFQKQENILDINLIERDLNEQQREAVFSSGNSQLVLSGAGSGKTRVLTYKIIYLLKIKNIPPENILDMSVIEDESKFEKSIDFKRFVFWLSEKK